MAFGGSLPAHRIHSAPTKRGVSFPLSPSQFLIYATREGSTLLRLSSVPCDRAPRRLWLRWALCLAKIQLAFWLLSFVCPAASADVGVVLNESLDEDVDRISSTGHSAIYFSRICPESPVKLRLCGPGEHGSVMSNYLNIGEDQPFEWNIVPLNIYLYGVEDPRNRPLFASYKIKHLQEERYREKYLQQYCASVACMTSKKAEWREMVAATLIRGVYIFAVSTTLEQDQQLIAEFNDAVNKNHFNGVTRNCADFTKHVINTYFAHAARTDYLNDFGMTSPKAVARTFTHYALHHPESQFRVMHFAQVPGTTKRSRQVREGTEQLFHSGKLLLPMVLISYYTVPAVTTSYILTGRFRPETEFEQHAAAQFPSQSPPFSSHSQAQIVGTQAQWKDLRKTFRSIVAEYDSGDERHDLNRFFKDIDRNGAIFLDENGAAWMEISLNGKPARLGLSASNILSQRSDSALSYELLLPRASHILKSAKHSRETMLEFKQDWANLRRASARNSVTLANNFAPLESGRGSAPSIQGTALYGTSVHGTR